MDDPRKRIGEGDALLRNPLSEFLREQKRQQALLESVQSNALAMAAQYADLASSQFDDYQTGLDTVAQAAEAAIGGACLSDAALRALQPELALSRVLEASREASQVLATAQSLLEGRSLGIEAQIQAAATRSWSAVIGAPFDQVKAFAPLVDQLYSELWRVAELAGAHTSFASDLSAAIARLADSREEEDVVAAWHAAASWYVAEAKGRNKNPTNYLAFFSILLALLIALYQKESASESEARTLARIAEAEGRVLNALSAMAPEKPETTVVFSLRRLRLRAQPSSKSRSLRPIGPNTPLEVLAIEGNWLRVRVFAVDSGEPTEGWVYGRFVGSVSFDP